MARISKKERELTEPGICTTCGADSPTGRNTAGQCTKCHNLAVAEYRERRAAWLEAEREKGRQYWRERGIEPGQKVKSFRASMLGWGGIMVHGVARVGVGGAYVHVKGLGYKAAPEGWQAA
jgi:ribosomal protein L40E